MPIRWLTTVWIESPPYQNNLTILKILLKILKSNYLCWIKDMEICSQLKASFRARGLTLKISQLSFKQASYLWLRARLNSLKLSSRQRATALLSLDLANNNLSSYKIGNSMPHINFKMKIRHYKNSHHKFQDYSLLLMLKLCKKSKCVSRVTCPIKIYLCENKQANKLRLSLASSSSRPLKILVRYNRNSIEKIKFNRN